MTQNSQTYGPGDILIDSNSVATIGMVLLFALTTLALIWNIKELLLGSVDRSVSFSSVIAAGVWFLWVYAFPEKHLKIAFSLLGAEVTLRIVLAYLHAGLRTQHSAAVAGSLARQIAYAIILVAITHWFKSVIRRGRPENPESSGS